MSVRIPIISTFDPKGVNNAEKGVGSLSKKMLKVGGIIGAAFAAVTAAVALPVKALFDLGKAFDDAFDTIRIGTGETGRVLEGLNESFRNVAEDSASSFEDISLAIADLNTRLGITGPELELLADQFTTLSRITGDDLSGLIENVTRLFNRANVPIEEQSGLLDMLFRASQKSGVSVADLAQEMDEYRTQFEASGFAVEEQLALLAVFGREGVRTESIVSAMASAQRRFARENVPLTEGMQDLIEEIRTVDEALAYSKGAEYFGRNAVEMVDAIRSGRLSYEEMANAILNGDDSIMAIAEETDDLPEAWDRFKNYLKLQFEPAATGVFNELTRLVDEELIPAADRVKLAYEEGGIEAAIEQIGIEWQRIYDDYIKPWWEDDVKPFLNNTVKPAVIEIATEIGTAMGSAMVDAVTGEFGRKMLDWAKKWSPSGLINQLTAKIVDGVLGKVNSQLEGAAPSGSAGPTSSPSPRVGTSAFPSLDTGTLGMTVTAADIGSRGNSVLVADGAVVINLTVSGDKSPQEVGRVVSSSMDDAIARLARELAVT